MKTYNFKKGNEWVESDYAPYNLQWQPRTRNAGKGKAAFARMVRWLIFWSVLGLAILAFWPVG